MTPIACGLRSCLCLLVATSVFSCASIAQIEHADRTLGDRKPVQDHRAVQYSENRQACSDTNPYRNAYFGDLHVHTSLSFDAYQQNVRTRPADAYAFARGETIPFHERTIQIDRPLDFTAVTDHAEFLGDVWRCRSENDPLYDKAVCEGVRQGSGAAFQLLERAFAKEREGSQVERVSRALKVLFRSEDPVINTGLCGEDGSDCDTAKYDAWQEIQAAAEAAYDRSEACRFTSFVGYEYSGVKTGSNYHRNIIFRNAEVPRVPVSYLDAPQDLVLWQRLEEVCRNAGTNCDYLSIPHNPNLSNGKLLTPDYSSATSKDEETAIASLRRQAEPLLEIFQHKGQSECINGLSGIEAEPDALCEFEQVRAIGAYTRILDTPLPTDDCGERLDDGGMINTGCISRNDFLRGALLTGMQEEQRLGVNPLQLGVIASTDTHESTPGAVDEQTWQGHVGREKDLALRLQQKTGLPYRLDGNPGGLAGVWAVENSRDALFDAMQRRETFGTSGPRILPRFFAGWSYPAELCEKDDFIERAYDQGVPMGARLQPAGDTNARPHFVLAALRDPVGNMLQGLQLIKGWLDRKGQAHVKVIDVAGDAGKGATVDLDTGEISGPGFNSLCAVYVDENFNATESSSYYMRVIETPSLRWSRAQCIALAEAQRPVECANQVPPVIQERAWTSPVWYSPGK